MWNKVEEIAKMNQLSEADLVDFALSHESKYDIIVEYGDAIVSNWYVDQLLEDFQKQKLIEADHDEAYVEMMERAYPHLTGEYDPWVREEC